VRENVQIDFPGVSAFPQWGGRAAVRSAWLHRRRAAAWRVETRKRDAFEIRLVGLGRAQSDMGACPGYVLSFGWREQSGFEVERHAIFLIDFYLLETSRTFERSNDFWSSNPTAVTVY
jgi:hypothetical protein